MARFYFAVVEVTNSMVLPPAPFSWRVRAMVLGLRYSSVPRTWTCSPAGTVRTRGRRRRRWPKRLRVSWPSRVPEYVWPALVTAYWMERMGSSLSLGFSATSSTQLVCGASGFAATDSTDTMGGRIEEHADMTRASDPASIGVASLVPRCVRLSCENTVGCDVSTDDAKPWSVARLSAKEQVAESIMWDCSWGPIAGRNVCIESIFKRFWGVWLVLLVVIDRCLTICVWEVQACRVILCPTARLVCPRTAVTVT